MRVCVCMFFFLILIIWGANARDQRSVGIASRIGRLKIILEMIHRYIIPPGEKMMMLSSLIVTCVGTERRNEHDEGDAFHPKHPWPEFRDLSRLQQVRNRRFSKNPFPPVEWALHSSLPSSLPENVLFLFFSFSFLDQKNLRPPPKEMLIFRPLKNFRKFFIFPHLN